MGTMLFDKNFLWVFVGAFMSSWLFPLLKPNQWLGTPCGKESDVKFFTW